MDFDYVDISDIDQVLRVSYWLISFSFIKKIIIIVRMLVLSFLDLLDHSRYRKSGIVNIYGTFLVVRF